MLVKLRGPSAARRKYRYRCISLVMRIQMVVMEGWAGNIGSTAEDPGLRTYVGVRPILTNALLCRNHLDSRAGCVCSCLSPYVKPTPLKVRYHRQCQVLVGCDMCSATTDCDATAIASTKAGEQTLQKRPPTRYTKTKSQHLAQPPQSQQPPQPECHTVVFAGVHARIRTSTSLPLPPQQSSPARRR